MTVALYFYYVATRNWELQMWLALYFYWIIQGLTRQLCTECLVFAVAGVGEPVSRPLGRHILVGKSTIMREAHITARLLSLIPVISPASLHVYPTPSNPSNPRTRWETLPVGLHFRSSLHWENLQWGVHSPGRMATPRTPTRAPVLSSSAFSEQPWVPSTTPRPGSCKFRVKQCACHVVYGSRDTPSHGDGEGSRGGRRFRPATFLCLAKPELACVPGLSPGCLTWKERNSWLFPPSTWSGICGNSEARGRSSLSPRTQAALRRSFIQDLRPDFCLLGAPWGLNV